jgi:hypothetical protein
MLIGKQRGIVMLEFESKTVEITEEEFEQLVENLRGKLTNNCKSLMNTNREMIYKTTLETTQRSKVLSGSETVETKTPHEVIA